MRVNRFITLKEPLENYRKKKRLGISNKNHARTECDIFFRLRFEARISWNTFKEDWNTIRIQTATDYGKINVQLII